MFKSLTKHHNRIANQRVARYQYETLEDRNLLAVASIFDGGSLQIELTEAMDVAFVQTDSGGNVVVNGTAIDGDLDTAGVQTVNTNDVTNISFAGGDGLTDLRVDMNGFFATGSLDGISFTNINRVVVGGNYATGNVTGNFVGDNGFFIDAGEGQLTVSGVLDIHSDDEFDFILNGENNDFGVMVNVTTFGNVELADVNGINLNEISAANLTLTAENSINDTIDGNIFVSNLTTIDAGSVNLGNDNATVDLFTLNSNTNGLFSLNNVDAFGWRGTSVMGSANIQAGNLVSMGPAATVEIIGDAVFDVNRLRLGVGGSNTFNSGQLNINSVRNAFVWENSGVRLFGDNTAPDLDIIATGDIVNADNSSIVVDGISSFQTTSSIDIGNALDDTFNSGQIRFFGGQVNIGEDSSTRIGGLANFAVNLNIESNGFISDTNDSYVEVMENATFISAVDDAMAQAGVQIGDTEEDFFTAGSVSFDVTDGNFVLEEDNSTVITSQDGFVNRANAINIRAFGNVSNDAGSIIDVDTTAILAGSNISIGQIGEDDNIQFGSVTVMSGGDVILRQDNNVFLTGSSFVGGDAFIVADGSVADSNQSFFTTFGNASFFGTSITLGDMPTPSAPGEQGDLFNVGTLQVGSSGEVDIIQNGNIVLRGGANHNAGVLRLAATGNPDDLGTISNEAGANLNVQTNMFVRANGDITLGSDASDVIHFSNLNFNTPGNVTITANFAAPDVNDSLFIFGTSNNPNQADELRLVTNVDVFDGTNSVIDIESFIRVESRNLVLGDTDTDCVLLPMDTTNHEFITTDGPEVVFVDDDCPDVGTA